ncbi:putative rhamnosyl transferase [Flavobacterium sp. D11R37]|uniref:glycosyltransferase n=1 Tax=Flavobacterium coralii TaxID=2838017 RepID=UPI001CA788C4|nr:glycosyltransferase [Flavobacterium coralii]MBY8963944.1 putative rhamnosyl transferase [Flavobacterium coralii]
MFSHYLITRFNLKNPKWDVTKNNETLLTDEWLEHRLWLFENFCLPSVTSQTSTNFTWLIYFDVTTPPAYRSRIESLVEGHKNIRLFYIEGMPAFYPEIQKLITAETKGQPYLITSRIDNDDCIHKDFIAEVQKQFNKQDYRAIDVIKGYSLQIKPVIMLGKKEHIFNPFISLIEKNENPKTVWFNDHNLWKKETRITQVTHKRLWMSIIHEKNKVNEFDGYGNIKWENVKQDFIVSAQMQSNIDANILPHSKWAWTSFKNGLYVNWVLFNKMLKKALGIYRIK